MTYIYIIYIVAMTTSLSIDWRDVTRQSLYIILYLVIIMSVDGLTVVILQINVNDEKLDAKIIIIIYDNHTQ